MGAHQDLVQRAVVLSVAVISAGGDGAFDALVGIAVHLDYLLLFGFGFSMAGGCEIMRYFKKAASWIDIFLLSMYNICGKYKGGKTPFKRKENCHDL